MLSENDVLKHWEHINAFETSQEIAKQKNRPDFTFYDGPPFATGLPHYGHVLAGTIKDSVCRFQAQNGFNVPRRFAWDCHGLPIEFIIEKQLGIKTTQQILDMGIDKYNQACRDIVMKYSSEWEVLMKRIGRWIDMKNDIKTMDPSYMETVWWVFSELYKKGLVYRGYKVVPYSMACATPLSNSEAKSTYKTVSDWSITLAFKIKSDRNICDAVVNLPTSKFRNDLTRAIAHDLWVMNGSNSETSLQEQLDHWNAAEEYLNDHPLSILVWTTTPWTLPSNLMLCVHPDLDYSVVFTDNSVAHFAIVATCRTEALLGKDSQLKVFMTVKGKDLIGLEYEPLFNYYTDRRNSGGFRIVADTFVQSDTGTGVVHCAPAFGAEDYKACLDAGVITKTELPLCPIDSNGNYVEPVVEWLGKNVKDAEQYIVEHLRRAGVLFDKNKICHPYPYCWRSDTPLIYKVCECWFINVEVLRERMLVNNADTTWVPAGIRDARFANWIENATDWCVSRNRYWGTPLPIWTNDETGICGESAETICIGSTNELEILAGLAPGSITDLHRDKIDHILIPSKKGGAPLKRCSYVFDCWMDSGCFPYAKIGYPRTREPLVFADFIAEGLDQTRGWFYTLMILGTALFDKSPFKNVIVNGIVLNEQGVKMAKNKQNYSPLELVLDKYGADALRLYLIGSPAVKGVDLKFKEPDIEIIVRKYHLMIKNVVKFYSEMVNLYNQAQPVVEGAQRLVTKLEGDNNFVRLATAGGDNVSKAFILTKELEPSTVLDHWIVECLHELCSSVESGFNQYKLSGITDKYFKFIDQLSRWYMNLNKSRFKKCDRVCLNIVGNCLYYFAVVTAPVAPFMAESVFIELHKISRVWFHNIEYANFDTYSLEDQKIDLSTEIDYYYGVTNPHSSIHYHPFPKFENQSSNESVSLVAAFDYFADLIDLTRMVRAKREHPSEIDVITGKPKKASSIKLSLRKIYVASFDNNVLEQLKKIEGYIMKELNVDSIVYTNDLSQFVTFKISPNIPLLKQRVTDGKVLGKIINYLKVYFSNASNINDVIANKTDITVPITDDVTVTVTYDELQIANEPVPNLDQHTIVMCSKQTGLTVVFDTIVTDELLDRYYCKLFYRAYQDARKKGGFVQTDSIHLQFMCSDDMFALLKKHNIVGDKSSNIPSAMRIFDENIHSTLKCETSPFEKHITLNQDPGCEVKQPISVVVDIEFDLVTLVLRKV